MNVFWAEMADKLEGFEGPFQISKNSTNLQIAATDLLRLDSMARCLDADWLAGGLAGWLAGWLARKFRLPLLSRSSPADLCLNPAVWYVIDFHAVPMVF